MIQVKLWVKNLKVSIEQTQELYRNMHEAYTAIGDSCVVFVYTFKQKDKLYDVIFYLLRTNALQMLLELLDSYTKETALKAHADTVK